MSRLWAALALLCAAPVQAQNLPLSEGCTVAVRPGAGEWEGKAAAELVRVLGKMTGHAPRLETTEHPVASGPLFVVGRLAVRLKPVLEKRLARVAKPHPTLRSDAVTLLRDGNVVYLAGSNDDSQFYAVMQLVHRWGCRWYLPTPLGECIPNKPDLALGSLDESYAPPFEVRTFWVSWNGESTGADEFRRHNFMNDERVDCGHALSNYLGDLPQATVAFSALETARHVAAKVDKKFAAGERFSLSMEDGSYATHAPQDLELAAGLYDKFFGVSALTDDFLVLYNQICAILQSSHPASPSKIGFLAYLNLTLPPQRKIQAASPLVAYLAPIDLDPNHGIGDPRAPELLDYAGALQRWSQVMAGRVVIYDYDQGMLVWRDLPDPSTPAVARNMKAYRDAGILGVDTESRMALGSTFLNLFFRGQLMWNPDLKVDDELAAFYPSFYGPAAAPMRSYWSAIFNAWSTTDVTEHEFFAASAIYTPALLKTLAAPVPEGLAEPYATRVSLARLGFEVLRHYMGLVSRGAGECDYADAAAEGRAALAAREQMTAVSTLFTTYRHMPEDGAAFFPGEVALMAELAARRGVQPLAREWRYDHDPWDEGLWRNWAAVDPPGPGQSARTDLYLQAQGLAMRDHHSDEGFGWYSTEIAPLPGRTRISFPGLFNESWLYVNGNLIAHREQKPLWWNNDYKFLWDVDLSGKLHAGHNRIALRTTIVHHMSGMFRRPFLYQP